MQNKFQQSPLGRAEYFDIIQKDAHYPLGGEGGLMDPKIKNKLDKFFSKYKTQKYRKGEIFIRAGDDPSGVHHIISGRVKKYAISKKGEELIVNMFKPPAFFPMDFAINQLPNNYFYETMEDSQMIKAPINDVVEFIKNEPEVLYDLLARVYKGSEGLLTRMTYLMAGNAYSRLVSELVIHAKRFGEKNNKTITLKVSEKDLATQVGMTRETVSREMKILKDKRLVSFAKGQLVIKNIENLEEELASDF